MQYRKNIKSLIGQLAVNTKSAQKKKEGKEKKGKKRAGTKQSALDI